MRPEDLRAYAKRDWARVLAQTRRVWAEPSAEHGDAIGIEVAERLRADVLLRHSEAGLNAARSEDLLRLVRLGIALRSVALPWRRSGRGSREHSPSSSCAGVC